MVGHFEISAGPIFEKEGLNRREGCVQMCRLVEKPNEQVFGCEGEFALQSQSPARHKPASDWMRIPCTNNVTKPVYPNRLQFHFFRTLP